MRKSNVNARVGHSDEIPETPDEACATAVRGKHAKAAAPITIRLDADATEWLRSEGPRYRAEINRILREKMLAETSP